MALIQSTRLGLSYKKQTAWGTAQTAANMWLISKINAELMTRQLSTEDDAAWIGKGTEFAQTVYRTAWDARLSINKFNSSQMATFLWGAVLGNVVKTGSAAPYTYTMTPMNTATSLQLPYFTAVQQLPGTYIDTMALAMVLDQLSMTFNYGPELQNSQFTASLIGSGQLTEPSGITLPTAVLSETLLNAGSMVLTINGVDYIANRDILSLTCGWNNNLRADEGYYPGSGYQTAGDATSGQIRGRLEVGTRQPPLQFSVRLESTSSEYTKLKAGTYGTGSIALTGATGEDLTISYPKLQFRAVAEGNTNGIASATITADPLYDPTNGIISVVTHTGIDGICQ